MANGNVRRTFQCVSFRKVDVRSLPGRAGDHADGLRRPRPGPSPGGTRRCELESGSGETARKWKGHAGKDKARPGDRGVNCRELSILFT